MFFAKIKSTKMNSSTCPKIDFNYYLLL